MQRGDVVTFVRAAGGTQFVKRIVGVGGDTVQMIDGVVQLNGKPVALEAAGRITIRATKSQTGDTRLIEHLGPGEAHYIVDSASGAPGDDTGVFTVPRGFYFVLGDNRDNSMDSRFAQFGMIPAQNIRGRVMFVIWNSHWAGWSGRRP